MLPASTLEMKDVAEHATVHRTPPLPKQFSGLKRLWCQGREALVQCFPAFWGRISFRPNRGHIAL